MSFHLSLLRVPGLGRLALAATLAGSLAAPPPAGPPAAAPQVAVPAGLQAGDLVFRRGRGLASRAVLAAERDSAWSHVGVVVAMAGRPYVAHAAPGVGPAGDDRATLEPVEAFLAPERAERYVVLRLRGAPAVAARAAELARRYALAATPFDDRFDAASARRVYCTELVWRAYREAGLDLAGGAFTDLDLPWGVTPVLLPGRLADHPRLERVAPVAGDPEDAS